MNIKKLTQLIYFISLATATASSQAVVKPLDHIVVIVNDDVITHNMLADRVNDFRNQLELSQLSRIKPETLKKQVLERMIRDIIQTQQAKLFGITVDDLMLNRTLEHLARNNNMSLEVFRDTIENEDINYARFREQKRNELIIKQLQQRVVVNKINISDQEIQQYIKQNESSDSSNTTYHLRHILIATPESASPDDIKNAQHKAELVYKDLTNGSKFEDLAIKESNGRNALKGGDLGERKANELPQLFIDAVKDLSPGESSKPTKSASGFHLLHLISSSKDQVMVKQMHTRHILLKPADDSADDPARETLLKLKQDIENGASFAELASKHSEDPGSKTKGGDLGWASPGDLTAAFEDVSNSLPIGQVSEPFKTQFGWHILEVLDHRSHDQAKTNKQNQARNTLQVRKIDEELRLWLRRIRDEAYVEFINN